MQSGKIKCLNPLTSSIFQKNTSHCYFLFNNERQSARLVMQNTYHKVQSSLRWKSSFKKQRIKIYFSIQREECGAICSLEKMMLNLQTHHSSALSKAGPLSWLDQHHRLFFFFLLCGSLSQEQHMLKIKTGGQDSCNVYSALPCGI